MSLGSVRAWLRGNRKLAISIATGALYVVGWALSFYGYLLGSALLILAVFIGGYDIARSAYYSLRARVVGIDTLVTIAAVGAIIIGEYWEAAAVIFLFTFGGYLESRTLNRTRSALKELVNLAPTTAGVLREVSVIGVTLNGMRLLQ